MKARATPKLLVSVRSAAEVEAALAGGADLVDVKEPARGPMGSADRATIAAVVEVVAGRAPVSAALGERVDWDGAAVPPGLRFAKWGLRGVRRPSDEFLERLRMDAGPQKAVLVAYADHPRCESPEPDWLVEAAIRLRFPVLLFDTAVKDGTALTDCLGRERLAQFTSALRAAGVRVALAGALDESEIGRLAEVAPDWFAVRGAACTGGRAGVVCADRVRRLKDVIAGRGAGPAG